MRFLPTTPLLLLTLAFILAPSPTYAQSGPALTLQPWPENTHLQARPGVQRWETHTKTNNAGARFILFEDASRFRLDPTDRRSPTLGYQAYALSIRSDDPALPPRLVDLSIGTAALLYDQHNWTVTMPIGVGFAGSRPFADSRAWYGKASLLAYHRLDERTQLLLALGYNGNRTIFPDIPLPGVSYIRRLSDTFTMTLGLPYAAIHWQPDDHWQMNLSYALLTNFEADIAYRLTDEWSIYTSFESQQHAFHRYGDPRNRRLLFQQRRAELGTRWQMIDQLELTAAAGYTFGGKLERGFDTRNTDTITRFGDAAYLRVGLDMAF